MVHQTPSQGYFPIQAETGVAQHRFLHIVYLFPKRRLKNPGFLSGFSGSILLSFALKAAPHFLQVSAAVML
ncbi:MAG: hypothetical protein GX977_08475 [Firmicutes bacterium]|nr:hypothetical protein [Bacillota bacterium]